MLRFARNDELGENAPFPSCHFEVSFFVHPEVHSSQSWRGRPFFVIEGSSPSCHFVVSCSSLLRDPLLFVIESPHRPWGASPLRHRSFSPLLGIARPPSSSFPDLTLPVIDRFPFPCHRQIFYSLPLRALPLLVVAGLPLPVIPRSSLPCDSEVFPSLSLRGAKRRSNLKFSPISGPHQPHAFIKPSPAESAQQAPSLT